MTIEIRDPGKPLTPDQLMALERELGARLPEEYSRFLIDNNGGVPHPNVVDIEGLVGTPTDVQEFFGIGLEIESSNIMWYMREISERLPEKTLPIACDSGGNLFCLSLRNEHAGCVIYVDLGKDAPTQHLVADNFVAFLSKIR